MSYINHQVSDCAFTTVLERKKKKTLQVYSLPDSQRHVVLFYTWEKTIEFFGLEGGRVLGKMYTV